MTDVYYKVTGEDGCSWHGGTGRWVLGEWREVEGDLVPCDNGLHLCREQDLVDWLGPAIWRAEIDGEIVTAADKVVARRARVVERLPWDEKSARMFAADCAQRVLPIFESERPDDDRPRKAIEAARAFARREISREDLAAARDAARAAARAAASDAAWDARTAASDAARAAEREWQTQHLIEYLNR